jgi:hypothetical protein
MNLEDIRRNAIQSANEKLTRHKALGAQSNLSIWQVAELLDVIHGMADESRITTNHLVATINLN